MKIGIVTDIHEDVERLAVALDLLRREGVERVVMLGDVFDTGQRIEETVALLAEAGAIGVWGNHDLGLCLEPTERIRIRYSARVLDYMGTLCPRVEIEDCLFSHGLPCWDATDPVVYYLGARPDTDEARIASFQASDCRVTFTGHFHRWLLITSEGSLGWDGSQPALLQPPGRYLVVVAAVCDGWCATFDTANGKIVPFALQTVGSDAPVELKG